MIKKCPKQHATARYHYLSDITSFYWPLHNSEKPGPPLPLQRETLQLSLSLEYSSSHSSFYIYIYIYIYIKHLEQFLTHTNTVHMAVIVIINIYSSGYLLFATASRKIFLSP